MNFGKDILPDTHPISIPPYRMAPTKLKNFKKQLKDFLRKVSFDQVSHVKELSLICEKKDGSLRMYIDYRQQNKVAIKNKYPI